MLLMKQNLQETIEGAEQEQETSQRLTDRLKAFQETAAEWQKRAAETSRKAAQATNEYVHEKPWTAIGTVAAVCFCLGLLIGRRRD